MSDELNADDLGLGKQRSRLLEAAIWVPNVFLVVIVVLYLVFSGISGPRVEPLVKTDDQTADRISQLERAIRYGKKGGANALELSRLYSRVGEYPWSVDALRSAEREGSREPAWKMKLGLAYLELGKNIDGLRVLKRTLLACKSKGCPANIKAKLEIFTRVAELLRPGVSALMAKIVPCTSKESHSCENRFSGAR